MENQEVEKKMMSIVAEDGSIEEVEVILAFEFKDTKKEYVVYTKNEKDENENVMDIVKIEDSDSEEVEDIWINFTTGTLETYSPTYYIQNGYLLQNEVKEDGY